LVVYYNKSKKYESQQNYSQPLVLYQWWAYCRSYWVFLIVNCNNQEQIDKFWNYFTLDGEESQCGWCIDKYGLRWQVLPENLGKLMSKPNSWQVMMSQKKIVIDEYL
jgi:predicted 3-demethylubiquinone-9 3-methyltransferase (glyoxalase superfamily)